MKVTLCQRCVRLDLCCCPPRSVHTPRGQKKITCLFFDLCDVTRTLSCSSQGLNICNDCVLNKPPSCFFLFKPSLLLLLYNHQVTTHTHVVHRIVYYKRLYINFSINILYVQMEGRQISIFLPIKLSWNTFFFFFCFIGKRTGKIYQGISCSILKW